MNGFRLSKASALVAVLTVAVFFAPHAVRAQTEEIQKDLAERLFLARLIEQGDGIFGATLQPVGDVLRAQLNLPAGQGLLVASLRADGPSFQAGLNQNDILLSLAGQPLASADDLTKQLKAAGDSAVPLKLLRGGKPSTIMVRPISRVTIGPAVEKKTEYFIGVSLEPVYDALRAQLSLGADRGVVISDVTTDSPAEKAGIAKHDIVLTLGDMPIDSPDTLAKQVQALQDKPTTMTLLHAGKQVTISITAAIRKVEASPPQGVIQYLVTPDRAFNELKLQGGRGVVDSATFLRGSSDSFLRGSPGDVQNRRDLMDTNLKAVQRIEALEKEIKGLREALEKINDTLKSGKGPKRD